MNYQTYIGYKLDKILDEKDDFFFFSFEIYVNFGKVVQMVI